MTWDEAMDYTESTIDQQCAKYGVTAEITDPEIIATSIRLLRIGRRNVNALLAEVSTTTARR